MLLKKIAVVLCSALLLPLAAGEKILFKDGDSVAFMGDSITNYGWSRPGGYIRLTVEALKDAGINISVIPAGVSANKSTDMHARLKRSVISKKPVWMTLSCGVNDVWHGKRGVPLDKFKIEITELLDKVDKAGIKVMILTATMITENVNGEFNKNMIPYNNWLRQIAKERGYLLADLSADMIKIITEVKAKEPDRRGYILTSDGTHMGVDGNKMMARGILRAFGVTEEQIRKTEENTWRYIPSKSQLITLNTPQIEKLEKICAERGITPDQFIRECVGKALNISNTGDQK